MPQEIRVVAALTDGLPCLFEMYQFATNRAVFKKKTVESIFGIHSVKDGRQKGRIILLSEVDGT